MNGPLPNRPAVPRRGPYDVGTSPEQTQSQGRTMPPVLPDGLWEARGDSQRPRRESSGSCGPGLGSAPATHSRKAASSPGKRREGADRCVFKGAGGPAKGAWDLAWPRESPRAAARRPREAERQCPDHCTHSGTDPAPDSGTWNQTRGPSPFHTGTMAGTQEPPSSEPPAPPGTAGVEERALGGASGAPCASAPCSPQHPFAPSRSSLSTPLLSALTGGYAVVPFHRWV